MRVLLIMICTAAGVFLFLKGSNQKFRGPASTDGKQAFQNDLKNQKLEVLSQLRVEPTSDGWLLSTFLPASWCQGPARLRLVAEGVAVNGEEISYQQESDCEDMSDHFKISWLIKAEDLKRSTWMSVSDWRLSNIHFESGAGEIEINVYEIVYVFNKPLIFSLLEEKN